MGLLVLTSLYGCAGLGHPYVKSGENAIVDVTCRLGDGRVVYTTQAAIAENKILRSAIFLPCTRYGPVDLVAGDQGLAPIPGHAGELERELAYRLSQAIVGLPVGENRTLRIRSAIIPALNDTERYIRIGRIVRFPGERTLSVAKLKQEFGHDPVAGEQAFAMPGIMGMITRIEGNDAHVTITVTDGYRIAHPYGSAVLRAYPDHYELVIDAREGQLVRTLGLVGRMTAVDATSFTLDYGDPFGGEEFTCDVCVSSVRPSNARPAGTPQSKEQATP